MCTYTIYIYIHMHTLITRNRSSLINQQPGCVNSKYDDGQMKIFVHMVHLGILVLRVAGCRDRVHSILERGFLGLCSVALSCSPVFANFTTRLSEVANNKHNHKNNKQIPGKHSLSASSPQ